MWQQVWTGMLCLLLHDIASAHDDLSIAGTDSASELAAATAYHWQAR